MMLQFSMEHIVTNAVNQSDVLSQPNSHKKRLNPDTNMTLFH